MVNKTVWDFMIWSARNNWGNTATFFGIRFFCLVTMFVDSESESFLPVFFVFSKSLTLKWTVLKSKAQRECWIFFGLLFVCTVVSIFSSWNNFLHKVTISSSSGKV